MLALGIDPNTVTNPDFFSLTNLRRRVAVHEVSLYGEFPRLPKVVRIEKRQVSAARLLDCDIARRRHATIRLAENPHWRAKVRQSFSRAVGGAVVNDNQLEIRKALRQYRLDRGAD
jgi:hypothetical protein